MATQTIERMQAGHATTTLSRTAAAFTVSAAITLVLNAVLTIVKDASEPLHDFMARLLGHHWTTHGVVMLIVFGLLGWALTKSEGVQRLSDTTLIASVVVGALINVGAIALWFVFV
jgi:hypothetical protein